MLDPVVTQCPPAAEGAGAPAPNRPGRTNGGRAVGTADYPEKRIVFDALNVRERLVQIISDDDLRRYIR